MSAIDIIRVAGALVLLLSTLGAGAETVRVAVAANFTGALNRLAPIYERASGHRVIASFGATGSLYAQIVHGAPFDVLLAADAETPARLEREGRALAGTRFTYAIGRLVLWSARPAFVDGSPAVLTQGRFARLAIANPKTAPYGAAAEGTLRRLGMWDATTPKRVTGENVAQAFQFVASGNAELGFVALAQVRALPPARRGSSWEVPAALHAPMRQDAVLLARAADKAAARAFVEFLRSAGARAVIEALGYAVPDS